MRELTKSVLSFSWAISLLGMKQAANLVTPGNESSSKRVGNVFDSITETAVGQLDESMKGVFRSGDNMQNRMVDMMFGWLNPANWNVMRWPGNSGQGTAGGSSRAPDPAQRPSASADVPRSPNTSTPGFASGWGPMPGDTSQ
jgi:hypothetical protein